MSDWYWWRRLRGGVWVFAYQQWHKVIPENYEQAFSLTLFKIEDHRHPWEKRQ